MPLTSNITMSGWPQQPNVYDDFFKFSDQWNTGNRDYGQLGQYEDIRGLGAYEYPELNYYEMESRPPIVPTYTPPPDDTIGGAWRSNVTPTTETLTPDLGGTWRNTYDFGTRLPWEQWSAQNSLMLQGFNPEQLSALQNAYNHPDSGGIAGVGAMMADPNFHGLSGAGGMAPYTGVSDIYGWEEGVRIGTVEKLDNGATWVYRDGMGNVLGEVDKSQTAAGRMASIGVTDTSLLYQNPDTPGLENLPNYRQTLWDILTGEETAPFLTNILEGDYLRQAQERDDLAASLEMRGIRNSTPGWRDYTDLSTQQMAANARTGLEALGIVGPQMQAAINAVYEQDMGVDERAYQQWRDTTQLQSDLDWRQDQTRNQSLELLLRALAPGTVGPGGTSLPSVPGAEPSTLSSLLEIWANKQDPLDWDWL
jgi:hypothetical protein